MREFLPRPTIAPAVVWAFPAPQRARLSNDIDLMLFDLPGQHVISAHLVLDVPLNAEPRDIEGVATICARTLDEGTLHLAPWTFLLTRLQLTTRILKPAVWITVPIAPAFTISPAFTAAGTSRRSLNRIE